MTETRAGKAGVEVRKAPRIRAGRNRKERHNLVSFHGHGLLALIIFAILALSVLGVGLAVASLTIFSVGNQQPGAAPVRGDSPSATPSSISSLIGHPVNGTLIGVWVDKNLVVIQPQGGQPVQALVTAKSQLSRGGSPVPISELISGDAVVVTFVAGPRETLEVATLNDVETLPTNTPNTTLAPSYPPTPTPRPTAVPTPTPTPGLPLPKPSQPKGP